MSCSVFKPDITQSRCFLSLSLRKAGNDFSISFKEMTCPFGQVIFYRRIDSYEFSLLPHLSTVRKR